MSTPNLPAVRLPAANGERVTADGLSLGLPPSSKFSVSWPTDSRRTTTPPIPERTNLTFMEADSGSSDGDSGNEHRYSSEDNKEFSMNFTTPLRPRYIQTLQPPKLPQLSRALSTPLPSQLGYLKHPHKSNTSSPPSEPISEQPPTPPDPSRLKELSVELADSVQMMIQTMLQISPPQLLDPAKEQFSACSLSVPTSSMSAMLTSMKNLNYISANMADLCTNFPQLLDDLKEDMQGVSRVGTPGAVTDFDIGEMLQSVGDSLSGTAANAGVDLVIYHEDDIGMRHVCVKGDESGISYALSHVIRQVLATTKPGDSIELGLLVGTSEQKPAATQPTPENDQPSADIDETLSCTIRISHKYQTAAPIASITNDRDSPIPARPLPSFSTMLLRHLLRQVGATLVADLPPPKSFPEGRTCNFTLSLDPGSLSVLNTPMVNVDGQHLAAEPSVDQLTLFAEGLRGKRVTLYANAKGSFAQRLTSYLTAWGMDVTHVSPDGEVDGLSDIPLPSTTPMATPPGIPSPPFPDSQATEIPAASEISFKNSPSFIFIDDDVEVLKERLQVLRAERPYNLSSRQRPPLAPHHRPRSTQQAARMIANGLSGQHTPVVVHFTSISNYKLIKDVVHSVITSHVGSVNPLPEVMIIPKPAGPRRFLTALYTAVTKPVVDPFFSPIATSPFSPNVYPHGSFYHSYHVPESSSPKMSSRSYRPGGSRSNSDRSTKSTKDFADFISSQHLPPNSPLAIPDNVEYFSEQAAKLGASPSSGLVIQSPDGQPAGIFFHPRGKATRIPSAHTMERDKGQFNVLEQKRRNSRLSVSNEPTNLKPFNPLQSAAVGTTKASPTATTATMMGRPPIEPVGLLDASTPSITRKTTGVAWKPTDVAGDQTAAVIVPLPSSSSPPQPRRSVPFETSRKPTPPPGSQRPEHPSSSPAATILSRRTTPRRTTQEPSSGSAPPPPSTILAAASKKVKAAADGNIIPPISVLIVDDNPINQTILSTFMKKKKIKFDLAKNGQEAVQKWRTGGFHLILMDIQMPIMDGIQATKEIRRLEQANAAAGYPPASPFDENGSSTSDISTDQKSSPYRSSVIIVALTASSLQSDRVAALAAGCNDFLTKPVSLVWLNSKIIEWGSIKALQMWADLRPEALTMSTEQAAHARGVAERLHVPTKGRATSPSPSRESGAAATQSPNNARPPPSSPTRHPGSPSSASTANGGQTASSLSKSDKPPPSSFWGQLGASSAKTLSESAKDLARGGRRSFSTPQSSLAGVASSIQAIDDPSTQALEPTSKRCLAGEGDDTKHDNIPSRPNSDDEDD